MRMKWTPEIRDYIEACYVGVEKTDARGGGAGRRIFRWKTRNVIKEGVVDDFIIHLEEKLNVKLSAYARDRVHTILRERGHQIFEAPHPRNPYRRVEGKSAPVDEAPVDEKPVEVADILVSISEALLKFAEAAEQASILLREGGAK